MITCRDVGTLIEFTKDEYYVKRDEISIDGPILVTNDHWVESSYKWLRLERFLLEPGTDPVTRTNPVTGWIHELSRGAWITYGLVTHAKFDACI